MVTPLTGVDVAISMATGVSSSLINESMSVVNDEFPGVEDYTVYQITDISKRYLDDSVIPTFQKSDNGTDWMNISNSDIEEIQYPGGRVVLKDPLSSGYYVRCSSGKYFDDITDIIFAKSMKISWKCDSVDVTVFKDEARSKIPALDDWSATIDTFVVMDDLGDFPQVENINDLKGEKLIAVMYLSESNDIRFEGYGYIESADINMTPGDVIQQSVSLIGAGRLYLRKV